MFLPRPKPLQSAASRAGHRLDVIEHVCERGISTGVEDCGAGERRTSPTSRFGKRKEVKFRRRN
jgi:hypothetical protein